MNYLYYYNPKSYINISSHCNSSSLQSRTYPPPPRRHKIWQGATKAQLQLNLELNCSNTQLLFGSKVTPPQRLSALTYLMLTLLNIKNGEIQSHKKI